MQSKDKVEQLKASMKMKKENEARLAESQEQGKIAPGIEAQYLAEIAELKDQLAKAQEDLEAAQNKSKEAQENFVRSYAEMENIKKRLSREKEEMMRYGAEKIFQELLPVLDGLEKTLEHARQTPDVGKLVEGVDLVLKQFLKAGEKFGLSPVPAVGEPFDPNFHEAMGHHESEEHEPDTVVNEYRRGYKFHDRLLRPALVTVAKPPEGKKS